MKVFCFLFTLILSVPTLFGQKDFGFYGNKFFVQVEGLANYPFFSNIITNDFTDGASYKVSDNQLVAGKDHFNYGFRASLGYAIKRNVAIQIEAGQDYSNASPNVDEYLYDDKTVSKHEMVDVVTTSIIPKFEFATSKSLLPMGIGHQVGFGVATSKVIKENYTYELSTYDSFTGMNTYTTKTYDDSETDIDPINFDKLITVKKYVLLYALNVRTPLTKSLLLNYGVRYTFNVGKSHSSLVSGSEGNIVYTQRLVDAVSRHRLGSIINLSIGLSYTF